MSEPTLIDQEHRERFRREWNRNFAVSANAGSGKTTAISERLAAIALTEAGGGHLAKNRRGDLHEKGGQPDWAASPRRVDATVKRGPSK